MYIFEGRIAKSKQVASLLALSILPLLRHHGYEVFLYLHRSSAVMLLVALWEHIRLQQTLSRVLLVVIFTGLLSSTALQSVRQVYKNFLWDKHGGHVVRTMNARQCGESLIVKIELKRPWKIQPGCFIYLRLLTLKRASIFQRHPFVIAWWDDKNQREISPHPHTQEKYKETSGKQNTVCEARALYVMMEPQHGWTRKVMADQSIFENQAVWLDGPFGVSYRLDQYSTVILFASGNGIVAQLPLLKDLATKSKASNIETRRVKLVWQTETSNEQLQDWMHEILRDEDFDSDVGGEHNVISQ